MINNYSIPAFLFLLFNLVIIPGCGGGSGSGIQNPDFRISSEDTVIISENEIDLNFAISVLGIKGDSVSFSLSSGNDGDLFSIDSNTGELFLNFKPDYENPLDTNKNNIYDLHINARNSKGDESSQDFKVIVQNEKNSLVANLLFPVNHSILEQKQNVYFRGSLENPDGSMTGSSVIINNNAASILTNEKIEWRSLLPLEISSHIDIQIETYLSGRLQQTTQTQLHNVGGRERVISVQLDSPNKRLILNREFGIWERNLKSGQLKLLCNNYPTTQLSSLSPILLDQQNNRIFGFYNDSLVTIYLDSCIRNIVSSKDVGIGQNFGYNPEAIIFAENEQSLFVADYSKILRVDLVTGNRSIVSGVGVGSGPELNYSLPSLMFDVEQNELYAEGDKTGDILSINPINGTRRVVINTAEGDAPLFKFGSFMFDDIRSRFIGEGNFGLMSVDLDSGVKKKLSDNYDNDGPYMQSVNNLVIEPDGSQIYMSRTVDSSTLVLNTDSRNRMLLEDKFGPKSETQSLAFEGINTVDIAFNEKHNRIILLAVSTNSLYSIDLNTGQLSLIVNLDSVNSMVLDEKRDRAIVATREGVLEVNLSSGETHILSPKTETFNPDNITLDDRKNILYVTDIRNHSIHFIDLITGITRLISSNTKGDGVVIHDPGKIAANPNGRVIYILMGSDIIQIDVKSGNRKILSGKTTGGGLDLYGSFGDFYYDSENTYLVLSVSPLGRVEIDPDSGYRWPLSYGENYVKNYWLEFDDDLENDRIFGFENDGIWVFDTVSGQTARVY